jgi:hypothetical protein
MTDKERIDWLESQFGCGLISDDNGHWTLSYDGIQNLPMSEEAEDIATSFFIDRDDWRNSIRGLIDEWMTEGAES